MKKKAAVQAKEDVDMKQHQSSRRKQWCALLGFRLDDHDQTGYLAFRSPSEMTVNPRVGVYKIVEDIANAKWFPCENYDHIKGFATPEKWLEFFNEEPLLKEWKFHLVKRSSTDGR